MPTRKLATSKRPFLTHYAAQAVRGARLPGSGDGEAVLDAGALLSGLLRPRDGTAARIVEQLGPEATPWLVWVQEHGLSLVGAATLAEEELLDRAWAECRQLRDERIGTEHVLLATVASLSVEGRVELEVVGIRERSVRWSIDKVRRAEAEGVLGPRVISDRVNRRRLPGGVLESLWVAEVLAGLSFLMLVLDLTLGGRLGVPAVGILLWLGTLLTALRGSFGGIRAVIDLSDRGRDTFWIASEDRDPRAWSAITGLLLVRAATATALLVTCYGVSVSAAMRGDRQRVDTALELANFLLMPALLCISCLGGAVAAMVRSRGWFGIGKREGWHYLMREARWVMLGTLLVDLPILGLIARS